MDYFDYYLDAFRKFADFSGRATRSQYWFFVLFNFIISLVLGFIDSIFGLYSDGMGFLSAIYGLVVLIPALALSVRRLHDTNRSGWWLLVLFIPIVGIFVFLYFMIQDSTPGANRYGPNPKGF